MDRQALPHGSTLARVRLTQGLFARFFSDCRWLTILEEGLLVEGEGERKFVPWNDIQSVRQGRADDAFVIVHSGGRHLVVPASTVGAEAEALTLTLAERAQLTWVRCENQRIPPIAVRSEDVGTYELAYRTWSRVD